MGSAPAAGEWTTLARPRYAAHHENDDSVTISVPSARAKYKKSAAM